MGGAYTARTSALFQPRMQWPCLRSAGLLPRLHHALSLQYSVPLARQWNSSNLTFIAFFLQNFVRFILLILCAQAWRALRAGKDGVAELRSFLRFLLFLTLLEVMELSIKAIEVHNVCDAPQVWARRIASNNSGLSEPLCELIADVYDYLWGGIVLLILLSVIRITHAHIIAHGGSTWDDHVRQTSAAAAAGPATGAATGAAVSTVPAAGEVEAVATAYEAQAVAVPSPERV